MLLINTITILTIALHPQLTTGVPPAIIRHLFPRAHKNGQLE